MLRGGGDTLRSMKAISLWEPWATAMALGLKKNETRHWNITYRGAIAIHAARRKMTADEQEIWDIFIKSESGRMPAYGCVVCVVEIYDWITTDDVQAGKLHFSDHEIALGNYSIGRYAWLTRNLRRLKTPVPEVGRQGLFNLSQEAERKVLEQL